MVIAAMRRLALLALLCGFPTIAFGDAKEPLNLKCVGAIASSPSIGAAADISFQTSVPFDEGRFITLSDPESGKVDKPIYDMEASTGSFQIGADPPQTIVWTRATGRNGWFVGEVIGSDGELFSLTIHSAPVGSTERPFALFGTAAGNLYRGHCV